MKRRVIMCLMFVCILSVASTAAAAGEPSDSAASVKGEGKKPVQSADIFVRYKPPRMGKPAGRVGGGTRGVAAEGPEVVALVPDHTGRASGPQPSLCWYLARPMDMRIEIVLNDESSVKPVLERQLQMPERGGIHCLDLAEHNIRLIRGIEYRWFVAVVPDPAHRSKDIVSGGAVMYEEPGPVLQTRLKDSTGEAAAAAYAEEGFWYDAVAVLGKTLGKEPRARPALVSLLEQAGLQETAKKIAQ